jgi:hypothetical protein
MERVISAEMLVLICEDIRVHTQEVSRSEYSLPWEVEILVYIE